jgi:hypothetical protein
VYKPTQSTDHAPRAATRFLEQFQGKRNLQALLKSYMDQIQALENATWEVLENANLREGRGVILNAIGRVVGRPRAGLADSDYLRAIRTQIRINRSSGRARDVIQVARLSFPDDLDFTYSEDYPAGIQIEIQGLVDFAIQVSFRDLVRTKAGGVRLFLLAPMDPPDTIFTLADWSDSGSVPTYDTDRGMGWDADPTMGGHLLLALGS